MLKIHTAVVGLLATILVVAGVALLGTRPAPASPEIRAQAQDVISIAVAIPDQIRAVLADALK